MTVEALKEAIPELSENERHSLAAWLIELEFDAWDKQMVNDFSPGERGVELAERVKRDIAAAKAHRFEEGRAEAKAKRDNRSPTRDLRLPAYTSPKQFTQKMLQHPRRGSAKR